MKKPNDQKLQQQQAPSLQAENQGPKIVRHHFEARPQDGGKDNVVPVSKKSDPHANLNRNKWEKKSPAEQQSQANQKIQQRADDGKKPKPPVDPKSRPQTGYKQGSDEVPKVHSNPSSAQNSNKKENKLKDVPVKRVESLERNNDSPKKPVVKKSEPQTAKDSNFKNAGQPKKPDLHEQKVNYDNFVFSAY